MCSKFDLFLKQGENLPVDVSKGLAALAGRGACYVDGSNRKSIIKSSSV